MALPLLPLPSGPALDDDDELQESTDGFLKVLNKLRGKNKRDWEAEWNAAAEDVGICALPGILGGRRLRFRRRRNAPPNAKRYELFFGTCDGLVVRVSLDQPTRFRAELYDMQGFRDDGTDVPFVTLLFNGSVGSGGVWNYSERGNNRPDNVEEKVWEKWHEFVEDAMTTIVDFVNLDVPHKANGFETEFDVNPRLRTLAAFLSGKYD